MRKRSHLMLTLLVVGCGDGTLVVDDPVHPAGSGASTNNSSSTTAGDGTNDAPTTSVPGNNVIPNIPDMPATTNNDTPGETTGTTGTTGGETTGMTTGPQFNQMFVAVADFMREKCVNCHNAGQNGNFVIPAADTPNETVRMNLEGVVARSGRLLVTPNNTAESQVYIMITNSAGEQFPPETIAIVADWINAGAPYDP